MTHALHLTTWHPYIDGVSGTFVLEQCAALRDASVTVGLLFSRIQGLRGFRPQRLARGAPGFVKMEQPVPTFGFKSWSMPGMNGLASAMNERMLCNRYAAYVRVLGRPDILHAHVALAAGQAARRIAADTGLGYVVTEHSSEILNGMASARKRRAAAAVYADARCVLAVSSGLADSIRSICPTANIRVVGNLVREAVFALRKQPADSRSRVIVVSIGSLSPNKRTHDAIAALAGLPLPLRDQIEHWIVGDGPARDALAAQAAAGGVRTIFHGNMAHDRTMQLLADADLLLHASEYETFGIVVAEAMALGVPVVATRCGGPESFVNGTTGVLVPVGDVDALRCAVIGIVKDRNAWKARSAAIAQYARDRFHESNVVSAIIESYR